MNYDGPKGAFWAERKLVNFEHGTAVGQSVRMVWKADIKNLVNPFNFI